MTFWETYSVRLDLVLFICFIFCVRDLTSLLISWKYVFLLYMNGNIADSIVLSSQLGIYSVVGVKIYIGSTLIMVNKHKHKNYLKNNFLSSLYLTNHFLTSEVCTMLTQNGQICYLGIYILWLYISLSPLIWSRFPHFLHVK